MIDAVILAPETVIRRVLRNDGIWHMDGLMRIMADGEFTELYPDAADDWKPVLK